MNHLKSSFIFSSPFSKSNISEPCSSTGILQLTQESKNCLSLVAFNCPKVYERRHEGVKWDISKQRNVNKGKIITFTLTVDERMTTGKRVKREIREIWKLQLNPGVKHPKTPWVKIEALFWSIVNASVQEDVQCAFCCCCYDCWLCCWNKRCSYLF